MIHRDRINDLFGLELGGPPRSCRDVNEFTYRAALAVLSEDKRQALNELRDRAVHAQTLDPRLRGRIQLAPLIVDSYGCWGDAAQSVLQTCAQ